MAKNKIQFQKGMSLVEFFQRNYSAPSKGVLL